MEWGWSRLFNLSTAEIHRAARDTNLPAPLHGYAQVLSAYLQGDREKLAKVCETIAVGEPTRALAELRLALRRGEVKSKALHALEAQTLPEVLDGEKYFCLGLAWELLGNDQQVLAMYTRAAQIYQRFAANSKTLRARFNAIVADSRLHPHKNFIAEYQSVIEEAKRLGERALIGIARVMLAREYQIVNLHEKALTLVDEGLADLELERGTAHYFHALLQKAHILFDLGRKEQMPELLKECELADFSSIRAARTLLTVALDPLQPWDRALEKDLLPTWKNRVPLLLGARQVVNGTGATSELERALLRLAYNGPIEKWDLIAKLYPQESDALALENRFKNLLARVRKKHPGILQCEGSRYFLAKLPERESVL